MSKKRVVVNYPGRKGGGAVYAYEMTKSLIAQGCRVYAIIARDIHNLEKWQQLDLEELVLLATYNHKSDYLINTIRFKWRELPKLKAKFRGVPVDMVYVPMSQPWCRLINSVFPGCPRIVTVHDPKPHSGANRYESYLNYQLAREAEQLVILSETFRDYTRKRFHKDDAQIQVIPHGVFNYYQDLEKAENCFKYNANCINFLFFGRIEKYKGLHLLAEAYQKLKAEYDQITLTVVGSGDFVEYQDEYRRLKDVRVINEFIKDEAIGHFFHGENVVTVLPYTEATQSGVIAIAMAYRSLVITSNTGGLIEQVADGQTGYLFQANDPQSLYQVMKQVVSHYPEQEVIRQNACTYIHSLSWDRLGRQLLSMMQ